MFDKLYKEANDEIPLNTVLMEQLKNEASKSRKKSYHSLAYKYGYAAAAAILIAVSINVLPELTKEQQVKPPVIEYTLKQTAEDVTGQDGRDEPVAVSIQPEEKRSTRQKPAPKAVKQESEVNLSDLNTEEVNSSELTAISEMAEGQPEENAKASGGGGSRMITDEPAPAILDEPPEPTLPEYLEQHGFDYSEEELPEGLVIISANTIDAEGWEGLYCVNYQGEEKSLSVTFYPESEPIEGMIDSMGNESFAFEEKGENECKAYVVKEEKGFVIESEGIESGEVREFIDSLI